MLYKDCAEIHTAPEYSNQCKHAGKYLSNRFGRDYQLLWWCLSRMCRISKVRLLLDCPRLPLSPPHMLLCKEHSNILHSQ